MVPQVAPPAQGFRALVRLPLDTHPGRLLAAWLVVRTMVWVAVVAVSYRNPPLDLVEWLSWGRSWEWGYPKHPPLPAWVADLFARLSPGDVWGGYLASYLTAAACVWAAFVVGRDYLPPRVALLTALALDGLVYLTHDAAEFSNNVVLNAGWAWTVVCFHKALRTGRLRWWAGVGVVVGLALLTKYTIGVLLLAVAGYVVAVRAARRCLRTPGPYLAVAVAAAVAAPHLAWLVRHDFLTLAYAAERSADDRGPLRHLVNPAVFALGQAALLVPVAFVLLPLVRKRVAGTEPAGPDRLFLHAVVLGPVAILLLLSAATGCQLRQIWGSPLWTFLGVWAVVAARGTAGDVEIRAAARRWAVVAAGFLAFSVTKQAAEPHLTGAAGRTQFPGKELATEVGRRWVGKYGGAYPIAAGEGWRAGNVCCFAPHRPVLYSSGSMDYLKMEPHHCPWTGDADLNARGGVIVWDADQVGTDWAVAVLRPRFPRIEGQPPVELRPLTSARAKPVRVGLAFVPPAGR